MLSSASDQELNIEFIKGQQGDAFYRIGLDSLLRVCSGNSITA